MRHVASVEEDPGRFYAFRGVCSCGWRASAPHRTRVYAQAAADEHVDDESFYVKRTRLVPQTLSIEAGIIAWSGPYTDVDEAEREAAAWEDAGWLAVVVPSTPASRELVERWRNSETLRPRP